MNDERETEGRYHASAAASEPGGDEKQRDGARGERIGVGAGDENVAKLQLAARWSEMYAPPTGDTLDDALRRFKRAYGYVDSVTKLVDPDES